MQSNSGNQNRNQNVCIRMLQNSQLIIIDEAGQVSVGDLIPRLNLIVCRYVIIMFIKNKMKNFFTKQNAYE